MANEINIIIKFRNGWVRQGRRRKNLLKDVRSGRHIICCRERVTGCCWKCHMTSMTLVRTEEIQIVLKMFNELCVSCVNVMFSVIDFSF